MTPAACPCGEPLAPDQRHCLRCGAATPLAAALRRGLWQPTGRPASTPAPAAFLRGPAALFGDERALRAAAIAFTLVLGTSAWAGARLMAPGPAQARSYVAAPAPATPAVAPAPTVTAPKLPADDDAEALELPSAGSTAFAATPALPIDDDPPPAATKPAAADDAAGQAPAEAASTTPPLDRVIVLALPPIAYDTFTDPAGAAPYLAGTLVPSGTLLRGFHGAAPSVLASNVALLSGQAPNPATLAGCPVFGDLTPATIGDDEQAAGSGCVYPADVFTVGDLLAATDRSWTIYSGAAASCERPADGAAMPAGRPAPLAFASVAGAPDCGERLAPLERLADDLRGTDAPSLAYAEVPGDSPAAIDAALRSLLPGLLADGLLPQASAVLIVPAHAPQDGATPDRAACCDARPWLGDDASAAGGGRTGALLLSPLTEPGTVLDDPLDHYDVQRTVATALGVRPLGLAAREEVGGLPAAAWASWQPPADG